MINRDPKTGRFVKASAVRARDPKTGRFVKQMAQKTTAKKTTSGRSASKTSCKCCRTTVKKSARRVAK